MTTKTLTYKVTWEKELTLSKKDFMVLKTIYQIAFDSMSFVLDTLC